MKGPYQFRGAAAMIVIHNDIGATYGPRAYEKSVDRRNRLSIRDERYALGREQPNYPVPAIPVSIVRGGNVIHWLTIVEHNKIDRVKRYWCAEEMLNELAWDTIRPYNHD